MRTRSLALAMTAATLAVIAPAARAATGPPPPTASGGQTVTQLAANLKTPTAFAYGHGTLFEADAGAESSKIPNGGVYVVKGGTATKLASPVLFSAGLAWHGNALYVSGGVLGKTGPTWELQKWSGFNGTKFASQKVLYTAPKGFDGFNGIAFGPDGRLYAGVDLGLTDGNDHGPATTSPDVYDILSFTAAGTDMKVFASGIRQPWQMVFAPGSSSPLVSDLGVDKGPDRNTALDSVLKVGDGDDFGFPDCSETASQTCPGAPKAFATFPPHSDIMGLAIIGKTLYMSSFVGPERHRPEQGRRGLLDAAVGRQGRRRSSPASSPRPWAWAPTARRSSSVS